MKTQRASAAAALLLFFALNFVQGQSDSVATQGKEEAAGDPKGKVIFKENVEYGQVDGTRLLADIAFPEGKGPFPVILSVHGGRWVAGTKTTYGEGAIKVREWAEFGFVAMSIDYRLAGKAPAPACYQDVLCAIRWVRKHARDHAIDPERIFLIGMSAGGHLVSLAATLGDGPFKKTGGWEDQPSHVRGVISLSAPYELTKLSWGKLWAPPGEKLDEAHRLASPLNHVSAKTTPLLIIHSDNDGSVPFQQALDMVQALEKAKAPFRFRSYKNQGHLRVTDDVIKDARAFIEEISAKRQDRKEP